MNVDDGGSSGDVVVVADMPLRHVETRSATAVAEGRAAQRGICRDFWGFLETRPYMRARAGLAIALIKLGDESAAIEHFRAMLKLNPNDNQGIRYLLLGCLLRHDDAAAVKTLLAAYKDEWSACWLYTRALVAFQDGHATEKRLYGWCRTPGQPTSTCLAYWLAPSRR